jgi:hypothetical protein
LHFPDKNSAKIGMYLTPKHELKSIIALSKASCFCYREVALFYGLPIIIKSLLTDSGSESRMTTGWFGVYFFSSHAEWDSACVVRGFVTWLACDQRISTPILEYMLNLHYADPSVGSFSRQVETSE